MQSEITPYRELRSTRTVAPRDILYISLVSYSVLLYLQTLHVQGYILNATKVCHCIHIVNSTFWSTFAVVEF